MYYGRISKDGKIQDIKKPRDEKDAKKYEDDMMTKAFADKLREYW